MKKLTSSRRGREEEEKKDARTRMCIRMWSALKMRRRSDESFTSSTHILIFACVFHALSYRSFDSSFAEERTKRRKTKERRREGESRGDMPRQASRSPAHVRGFPRTSYRGNKRFVSFCENSATFDYSTLSFVSTPRKFLTPRERSCSCSIRINIYI